MNLARSLSYYTATAMFNSAVPFLLLPVFTRYLSPADYGLVAAITAYVALLAPAIVLGLPALFSVDFHRLDHIELRRKSIVWLGLPLTLGVICIVSAWLLRDALADPLSMPAAWVPVVPLLALLGFIPQWTSVMFRLADRPRQFAAYESFQALLQLGAALVFIVPLSLHWQGRLWALLLCGVVANIVGLLALRPYLALAAPRRDDLHEAAKFGAGLLPHAVLSQLIRLSDRLFIVHFIGLAAAGEFAVGWQVASIMLVLLSTFNQAWTPYLFRSLVQADEQRKRELVKLSYKIAMGFVGLFVLVNAAAPLIFSTLISPQFRDAQRFIPFITVAYLFVGFYMLFTDYIFYSKKTHLFSIVTTANAFTNLALNYVCVQHFGAIGVTYAFAASSALVMVAAWLLAHKVYPMPWFGAPSTRRSA